MKENKENKSVEKQDRKSEKRAEKENKELMEKIQSIEKENEGLNEKVASLEGENKELREKLDGSRNDYLRLIAEFDTFRRRSAQDRLDLVGTASAETIKGLLPVLDDCENAMAMLEKSSDDAAKEGTALIYNKLMAYLKTKGLERIEAKGAKFDTDFHEAVAQLPVQDQSMKGLVYDVVETGYMLGGKVLRFAKVVVGA